MKKSDWRSRAQTILFQRRVQSILARSPGLDEYLSNQATQRAEYKKKLESDKDFILESAKALATVHEALASYPADTRYFLNRFSWPNLQRSELREFLRNMSDDGLRRLFEDYLQFANRFDVTIRVRQGGTLELYFRPQRSPMLQAKLVGEHLEPKHTPREDGLSYGEAFTAEKLVIFDALQQMIDQGYARIVELRQESGRSLLDDLEALAYDPYRMTFIRHDTGVNNSYLFCLIGETVNTDTWRKAGKVVSEFQREILGREKAGRPADTQRMKEGIRIRSTQGLLKEQSTKEVKSATDSASDATFKARLGNKLKRKR